MSNNDIFTAVMARVNLKHDTDNEVYGLFSFNPPTMPDSERAPLDIAIALDRSSSMSSNSKMELAKRSILKLVEHLKAGDRLSLVTFDSQIEAVFEPVTMTAENKSKAIEAIKGIYSRGCTNLSGGLLQALSFLSAKVPKGTVRRCMLFTDGQANEGIKDAEGILTAASKTRNGTPISTFGYGTTCNSELLEQLAVDGGNYHYIDTPDKILSAFGVELGGLISTYGQNVQVTLAPADGVEILEVLNDISVKENDDGTIVVTCDDLLAEQPFHLVLKLKVGSRDNAHPRATALVKATAKFYDVANTTPVELTASMKVKFVKNGKADTTDNPVVMEEVALQKVVAAQTKAILRANAGDYQGAQVVMEEAAFFAGQVGTEKSGLLGGAAAGMGREFFGSHDSYVVRGGQQKGMASRQVLRRRSGGSAGLEAGGVQMDALYSNAAQTGTRGSFEKGGTGVDPDANMPKVGDYITPSPFTTPAHIPPALIQQPDFTKFGGVDISDVVNPEPKVDEEENSKGSLTKSRSDRW